MRKSLVFLALLAAACGGTTSGVTSADIQAFNTAAQGVSTAAASYGSQAAGMTSAATCTSAQTSYSSQVRPLVDQMKRMGTAMDDRMGSMGHMADGDMECGANAMEAELTRHGSVACASATDMTPNMTEAQQHVATMTQWANHQMARSHEMGSQVGMGMGGMGGGGMTTGHCVHDPGGSYSMGP
jgi:hypothetical protein